MKVLFFTIATDKYYDFFIENLFNSLKKHVKFDFNFVCFTDKKNITEFKTVNTQHLPFPLNTLLRYEIFVENHKLFKKYDYVFYLDADMVLVGDIGQEIISDVVNVLHPGFYEKHRQNFPYEKNEKSTAHMTEEEGVNYYQGCFQGGKSDLFLNMCYELKQNIRKDLKNNIIADWWDESHMNKYRFLNPPTKILSPDYALPSEWLNIKKQCLVEEMFEDVLIVNELGYQKLTKEKVGEVIECNINYESADPKILHIKKDHESIRQ